MTSSSKVVFARYRDTVGQNALTLKRSVRTTVASAIKEA